MKSVRDIVGEQVARNFESIYMFWISKMPAVQKGLWCRPASEIPYVRLKDTTWGKQYKEREGKEYGEN